MIPFHTGQQEIVNDFVLDDSKKYGVVCVGRQWGKSLMSMNVMIGWMMSNPKAQGGWITPNASHWGKVFNEIKGAAHQILKSSNRSTGEMTFKSGATLKFLSTENVIGLRGFTFTHVVVDEAGFVKTEAFDVLRPTMGVMCKKAMFISTPGIKNWFWDFHQLGYRDDKPKIISFKATSYDNPYYSNEELDSVREVTDPDKFKQEYLAEFSDASGGVFMEFERAIKITDYVKTSEDECYIGVDIARGGKDFTSVVVMNEAGHVINREWWQEWDTEKQIEKISTIIERFPNTRTVMIEENQEVGIFQSVRKRFNDKMLVKGFYTTAKNKPALIQNLAHDIFNKEISLPTLKCDRILFNELSDFSYIKKEDGYIKYAATEGKHDDSVVSLALANEARVPVRYVRKDWLREFNRWNPED